MFEIGVLLFLLAFAWIPMVCVGLPAYFIVSCPWVLFAFIRKWRHRAPKTTKVSVSSIPAMVMHKESLTDFLRCISNPRKKKIYDGAVAIVNKLVSEMDKRPEKYPTDRDNFVVNQVVHYFKENNADKSFESEKFITLLRKDLHGLTKEEVT